MGGEWSASLYARVKDPRYPLERRLGGPQSRSGQRPEEKFTASVRDQTLIAQLSDQRSDTTLTELPSSLLITTQKKKCI
jgi:hypothetical protein